MSLYLVKSVVADKVMSNAVYRKDSILILFHILMSIKTVQTGCGITGTIHSALNIDTRGAVFVIQAS